MLLGDWSHSQEELRCKKDAAEDNWLREVGVWEISHRQQHPSDGDDIVVAT